MLVGYQRNYGYALYMASIYLLLGKSRYYFGYSHSLAASLDLK